MNLEAKIMVRRTPLEVWSYLGDVANVPKWDRGVKSVRCDNPEAVPGVGFEFSTLADAGGRDSSREYGKMSYRIAEADPVKGCKVQLTNSDGNARFFKQAEWRFKVDPAPEGAWVTCVANFTLRARYMLLAPMFLMMRGAIYRDLQVLKGVLENG